MKAQDVLESSLEDFDGNKEVSPDILQFPSILFEILSRNEFTDIISWMPNGRSWKVLNSYALQEIIFPQYFKFEKYHTFSTLVEAWNFCLISSGIERGCYYHELFQRGKPLLLKYMAAFPKTPKQKSMPIQDFSFTVSSEKVLPISSALRCQHITNQPSKVKKTQKNDLDKSVRDNKEPLASDGNSQLNRHEQAASFREISIKLEHARKMANYSRRRLMLYELSKLQQMEVAKYEFALRSLHKTKSSLQKESTFAHIEDSSLPLLSTLHLSGYRKHRLRHKQHLKEFRRHFAVKK